MNVRTKKLTVSNLVDPFIISHHELGYWPVEYGNHQVTVNGLDGGTYTLDVRVPGDSTFQVHQPGAAEADTVIVDKPVAAAFQLRFAGLGGAAAPVVTISSWPRSI